MRSARRDVAGAAIAVARLQPLAQFAGHEIGRGVAVAKLEDHEATAARRIRNGVADAVLEAPLGGATGPQTDARDGDRLKPCRRFGRLLGDGYRHD
jgi:hypothetical protein